MTGEASSARKRRHGPRAGQPRSGGTVRAAARRAAHLMLRERLCILAHPNRLQPVRNLGDTPSRDRVRAARVAAAGHDSAEGASEAPARAELGHAQLALELVLRGGRRTEGRARGRGTGAGREAAGRGGVRSSLCGDLCRRAHANSCDTLHCTARPGSMHCQPASTRARQAQRALRVRCARALHVRVSRVRFRNPSIPPPAPMFPSPVCCRPHS